MKTNLQNRPKLADLQPEIDKTKPIGNIINHMNKTEAWFVGFEKELRKARSETNHCIPQGCRQYIENIFKEILGEDK